MIAPSVFALSWAGGGAERSFRRRRPGVDDLPWGTLRPADYPSVLVDRARLAWTDGAYVEWATGYQLALIQAALMRIRAPVDLVGMAGDFVADEMLHVELHARVVMELGGAVPYLVDDANLAAAPSLPEDLRFSAAEALLRTCCIGETLAVPMLAAAHRVAGHPLVEAVLARIVEDEGPHAQLGWAFFEWADDWLDDGQRAGLAAVARDEIAAMKHLWTLPNSRCAAGVTSEGFALGDVHALGWLDTEAYLPLARATMRERVVARLRRHGIDVGELASLGLGEQGSD